MFYILVGIAAPAKFMIYTLQATDTKLIEKKYIERALIEIEVTLNKRATLMLFDCYMNILGICYMVCKSNITYRFIQSRPTRLDLTKSNIMYEKKTTQYLLAASWICSVEDFCSLLINKSISILLTKLNFSRNEQNLWWHEQNSG